MKILVYFVFLILIVSCTKKEADPLVTELPFFFIANINGQNLGFGAASSLGPTFDNEAYSEVIQLSSDSFHVYEGTRVFDVLNAPSASARVSIMRIFNHLPTAAERAAIVDTGYYRYALSDSLGRGGAVVHFTDGNGRQWSTENHRQTDTTFRIESLNAFPGEASRPVMQATFRCRLFSTTGDSMNLETGSVRGKILKP